MFPSSQGFSSWFLSLPLRFLGEAREGREKKEDMIKLTALVCVKSYDKALSKKVLHNPHNNLVRH